MVYSTILCAGLPAGQERPFTPLQTWPLSDEGKLAYNGRGLWAVIFDEKIYLKHIFKPKILKS